MDFNNHYIRLDAESNITRGFSDAFEEPKSGDVLINDQGGRHFQLHDEENLSLHTDDGIPLYKWDGKAALVRPGQEIEAARQLLAQTPQARMAALEGKIAAGLPQVVAYLYDAIEALQAVEALQVDNQAIARLQQPNEPCKAQWRQWVDEYIQLK